MTRYKGILHNDHVLAIKRTRRGSLEGAQEFKNDIKINVENPFNSQPDSHEKLEETKLSKSSTRRPAFLYRLKVTFRSLSH
ncbi:hypothetical protein HanXRQr2_Chr11g0482171 [Helianthus annuus]|uniref:Uncharacterized protein n=1 Tax=Helianthus annuus TaxID=4232 RepID=A0A251TAX2_HELAN|nr:hypothetical protein HanXRQr2_Chr11g0482171 [Helianthus annuus]